SGPQHQRQFGPEGDPLPNTLIATIYFFLSHSYSDLLSLFTLQKPTCETRLFSDFEESIPAAFCLPSSPDAFICLMHQSVFLFLFPSAHPDGCQQRANRNEHVRKIKYQPAKLLPRNIKTKIVRHISPAQT